MAKFATNKFLSPSLDQSPAATNVAESAYHTLSFELSQQATTAASYPNALSNQTGFIQPNPNHDVGDSNITSSQPLSTVYPIASFPSSTLPRERVTQAWEDRRPEISRRYLLGQTPSQILEFLNRDPSFQATPDHLRYRLKGWGLLKPSKSNNKGKATTDSQQRTRQDKGVAASLSGKRVSINKFNRHESATPGETSHTPTTSTPASAAFDILFTSITGTLIEAGQQSLPALWPSPLDSSTHWLQPTPSNSFRQPLQTPIYTPCTPQPYVAETSMLDSNDLANMSVYPIVSSTSPFSVGATEPQDYYPFYTSSGISSTTEQDFNANFPYDHLSEAIDTDNYNTFKHLIRMIIQEDKQGNRDKNLTKYAQSTLSLSSLALSIVKHGNRQMFQFLAERELITEQQVKDIYLLTALVNGHDILLRDIFKRYTLSVLDLDNIFYHADHIRTSFDRNGRRAADLICDQVFENGLTSLGHISALHLATALLLEDKIKYLVAHQPDIINLPMANGQTALHILANKDFSQVCDKATRVIESLLSSGANISHVDAAGNTYLQIAASKPPTSWTAALFLHLSTWN